MTSEKTGETRRRTVLKGAAWTLPVIAGAAAAPSLAASPPPCPTAPCFTGEIRNWTNVPTGGTGDIHITTTCGFVSQVGSTFSLIISPADGGTRTFTMQDGAKLNFLQSRGNTSSATEHVIKMDKDAYPGNDAFMNWSYQGYPWNQHVTLTLKWNPAPGCTPITLFVWDNGRS